MKGKNIESETEAENSLNIEFSHILYISIDVFRIGFLMTMLQAKTGKNQKFVKTRWRICASSFKIWLMSTIQVFMPYASFQYLWQNVKISFFHAIWEYLKTMAKYNGNIWFLQTMTCFHNTLALLRKSQYLNLLLFRNVLI